MKKNNIGINLTRRCNMNCDFCFYTTLSYSKSGNTKESNLDISLDCIKEEISKIKNLDAIYLTGGEPLLNKDLKDIIIYLRNHAKKIFVCTNALLLDEKLCSFFKQYDVTTIMSIKDNSEKTYNKINFLHKQNIKIELYHILTKSSIPLLKDFCKRYDWVSKVRLLYETSSETQKETISPEDWFMLLKLASYYLNPIITKIEVEIGYLPKDHQFVKRYGKGEVKRIILDYNGKFYPCPLLVERDDGVRDILNIPNCTIGECPVIKNNISDQRYEQICPFIITNLASFHI